MGREVRLFLLPDGEVQMMVDGDVSFDEAVVISRQLEAALGKAIPTFRLDGEPESHRNPDVHHVHLATHAQLG